MIGSVALIVPFQVFWYDYGYVFFWDLLSTERTLELRPTVSRDLIFRGNFFVLKYVPK